MRDGDRTGHGQTRGDGHCSEHDGPRKPGLTLEQPYACRKGDYRKAHAERKRDDSIAALTPELLRR